MTQNTVVKMVTTTCSCKIVSLRSALHATAIGYNWRTLLVYVLAACAVVSIISFSTPSFAGSASAQLKLTCARDIQITGAAPGRVIVESVFATIQTLLTRVGATLYVQIVNTISFQAIIGAVMGLYIAIYGVMVFLNLANHSLAEISGRLIRIAIFYALLTYGVSSYIYFDKWFVTPFLGGMNALITMFATAAGVPVIPPPLTLLPVSSPILATFLNAVVAPSLDPGAVAALYIPMNIIFSPFYLIAILAMFFLKGAGPIIAGLMVWGLVEFALLIFHALIIYVRSIIGLVFMFGIAPIFIAFLLFQRTRDLFLGWLNVVIGFAIAPVMLFAFLSFFCLLLTGALQNMFIGVDFCWVKFFTISGSAVDVKWWRPAVMDRIVDPSSLSNDWKIYAGDWDLPSPAINIINILFFLFLSHLGKNFTIFLDKLAATTSDGIGTAMTPGQGVSHLLKSAVMSGRGTGPTGLKGR